MIIDPYTWHRVTITSQETVARETVRICTTKPEGYVFKPGQYTIVRVTTGAHTIIRQYSYISAPEDTQLEFLIQLETGGAMSGWLGTDRTGATIEVSQAYGGFTRIPDTHTLLIAGHVGVAPYLSMLRSDAQFRPRVFYSVRGIDRVCFAELLEPLSQVFDSSIGHRIATADCHGYLSSYPDAQVYVCGSKRFVDSITTLLSELDVPAARVHSERFTLL